MSIIALKIEVPIASFRVSRAREYAETYPVPPPATIYGMLLSMVGEMDRYKHQGVQLAIALEHEPEKSTILRTVRRFKNKDIHDAKNARPDYQELLTDIAVRVWVNDQEDQNQPSLCERIIQAFRQPETVNRFGGLCLGESRDLVNSINLVTETETISLKWLQQDENGLFSLPYWVDHLGSKQTRWKQYQVTENILLPSISESYWTTINSD